MQKNETAESSVLRRRICAAWRTRACAAGLCVGAQVFLLGSGIAMPLCLNSAWMAALIALPACAAAVWACRRALLQDTESAGGAEPLPYRAGSGYKERNARPRGTEPAGGAEPLPYRAGSGYKERNARPRGTEPAGGAEPLPYRRARYILLALTLAANAALALAALVSLAEQSLLTQAQTLFSAGAATAAALLCALSRSTGVSRLCFALRFALPIALALLTASSVPLEIPAGLFPIWGAGALPLAVACACMLSAAAPVLMLLLPPPELEEIDGALRKEFIPGTGFFLSRVLPGAAFGCLLLFVLSVCSTYESIAAQKTWGERLRILSSGQPHEGIGQALLAVCQMLALLLLAVSQLCAAEQALVRVLPRLARLRTGLLLLTALLALCLLALIVFGFDKALFAAAWLALPSALCLLLPGRKGKNA